MANSETSRRDFLRAAASCTASGAGALAASGSAAAQASVQPDYGGYLQGANGFNGSTTDLRGQDAVTIEVGAGDGYAFNPAAVWVDPGTTITWEWTGNGGDHNVVGDNTDFSSGDPVGEEGYTYEQTFEESGIVTYYCDPHRNLGMLGAVAVGDDIATVEVGGESGPALPGSAKTIGVASGVAMASTLGLAYFFMKYGGDYGDPEV